MKCSFKFLQPIWSLPEDCRKPLSGRKVEREEEEAWASLRRAIHKRSFCHLWGMLDDEDIDSTLFPGVPPHIGSWEPPLYPGRLIIVDQRRESYWGGGGRGEVLLIESEHEQVWREGDLEAPSNKPDWRPLTAGCWLPSNPWRPVGREEREKAVRCL